MIVLNVLLLNLLWFASVLGAANQMLWLPLLMLLLLMVVVFIYQGFIKQDIKIIAMSLFCGLLFDGFLAGQGIISYAAPLHDISYFPPVWILMLWVGFGATVRVGMQWLLKNSMIGGAFILIGAPLSYYSAAKLNAVVINDFWQAMTFISISWLMYFILLVQITQNKETRNNAVA